MELFIESTEIDFHQIVDNSPNSAWIIDRDGKILYANKACLNLFQLSSAKDFLSKDLWYFLHPSFLKISRERITRVFEKQEILDRIELKLFRSDGKLIDVEVVTAPFYLKSMQLAQVCMQDITNRKAAEKLLNEREKLSSVGQIAAGIAHEVKNPLTSVKGFLQLMKEESPHPYLLTMEEELAKALNILQTLLQVSKPDLEDEPLVPIDLCELLISQVNLFQERLYKIEVEMDLKASEQRIVGKRNLFQRAFFNLIKNAIEAIEDRGTIRIEHSYNQGWIHIRLSDTGIGIPQGKLKLLGTPFFTTKSDGTGLGLTQVFTTIHDHYGNISIESEIGKGTTFYIQLPVKENVDS